MRIKSIFKRSLAVVLAIMMLLTSGIVSAVAANVDIVPVGATVTYEAGDVLFFNMSAVSWWTAGTNGNGNFAYFFNDSTGKNAWSAHAVQYSGSVYYVKIPAGTWEGVILTRNNTSTSPSWNNKWNQTGNIALSSSSNYISKFSENSTSATWSTQKPASNVSLTASKTSVNTGENVTLTPSLTSNTTYNEIKSTTYSVSPSTGASVSGNTFTATAAGTYTVTATITYNPRGYSNLTTAKTATTTIKATTPGYSYTVSAGEGGTVNPAGSFTGTSVDITAIPETGYVFDGWTVTGGSVTDKDSISTTFTPSANNATVTANFKKSTYTVEFVDYDGTVIKTQTVEHGESATAPADPTRAGYNFIGWDGVYNNVTSNLTINALYIEIKYVTYTFKDYDGTVLATDEIVAGNTPPAPQDPTREGYNFIGWDPEVDVITDDVIYTAQYAIKTYTVTFLGKDGETTLATQTVNHGSAATAPENTAVKGYTFTGWDKSFDNITADTTVTAQYTANTYTVSVSATEGGTASATASSVTYPGTVTLTAEVEGEYKFTDWTINGAYGIVSGSVTSEIFEIIPEADITATANFVEGQYLTVYTYSGDGYNKLTLTESNGTSTIDILDKVEQTDEFTYEDTTWQSSGEQELTNGYSSSVTAQLSGDAVNIKDYAWYSSGNFLYVEGYKTIVVTNNHGWSDLKAYVWNSSTNKNAGAWPGTAMTKAYTNSQSQDVYVILVEDSNDYNYVVFSGSGGQTVDLQLKSDVQAFWIGDKSGDKYPGNSWDVTTYTPVAESNSIQLKSYLYTDTGAWAGVSEVWIYQNGTTEYVTLRRGLLNLLEDTDIVNTLNTGNENGYYTSDSWEAFVDAYEAAKVAMADVDAQQEAITAAETELDTAFHNLTPQNYFTVTVTQNGGLGTVKVNSTDIKTAEGTAQVPQNTTATITVTAPEDYYIVSITGDIVVANQVSPYETTLTVSDDIAFEVTYAQNPTVTVTESATGTESVTGTVKINGVDILSDYVNYNNSAEISIKAPDKYYIAFIMVGDEIVFTDLTELVTSKTYTIDNVTADTDVTVGYNQRDIITLTIGDYDTESGSIEDNSGNILRPNDTIEICKGDVFTFIANPNVHFAVADWLVNGVEKGANSYYNLSVTEDATISIKWVELKEATVSIIGSPNTAGTVTATANDTTYSNTGISTFVVEEGTTITLKAAVTDTTYVFSRWEITGDFTRSGSLSSDEIVITAKSGDIYVRAIFTQIYKKVYLKNEAGWQNTPKVHYWGGDFGTTWPGIDMTYNATSGLWEANMALGTTGVKFSNAGADSGAVEFQNIGSKNYFNNKDTNDTNTIVDTGYYLQGNWNGKTYSAYNNVRFTDDFGGNYVLTLSVTSTTDGYIYVNPTNDKSHFWNAATANATGNPQKLNALGAYTSSPNKVKVEIDTSDYDKDYDVTFIFNPTTGDFSWTKVEHVPTITVNGTDGRTKEPNKADANMDTNNGRVGDTYLEGDAVRGTTDHTYYQSAEVISGEPVDIYTQVNGNGSGGYNYYVAGWVINGTQFQAATSLGNGLYTGSYTFTEDNTSVVPVYFHTKEWITANNVKTVTVYAVADKNIDNWDKYLSAYTWYKIGGVTQYEQFGYYPGQLMIPVTGLNGVYYTYVEYSSGDKLQISGITFNNYADNEHFDASPVTEYTNIQTYDYYEFISLLNDGKDNITFVIKDTNDTYNSDKVAENTNETLSQFDFVQFTDYSGLKTDIFGNNIEAIDATLSDSNALYVIQAGDKNYSGVGDLDGQWYVDCFLYDATGKYLGKCYSYELHKEDSEIWSTLAAYENQRAYFSYEHVNNNRYDGEWYGDAQNVSVTINLAVNVAIMGADGEYTIKPDAPVNESEVYGKAYINATEQNVDVARGTNVSITAKAGPGYKFVGWYSADRTFFSANVSVNDIMAAVGTTYTAVFEKLEDGMFNVNHYIYQGGGSGFNPLVHGGNAILYVGIENKTQGTEAPLTKVNSAYLAATEGDKLIITIATDATGADKFFAWYVDAITKDGKTTFEEVGVDTDDNLYDNGGTVVGRNDMVYFQFEYVVSDVFSMTLYSDLQPVSAEITLVYQYTDRYENIKYYYVPYNLEWYEIDGFAGNEFKPYTPAYITSTDGSWINTVIANAPYIEDYYKDATWKINTAMYDTMTFLLWATQPYKTYTVKIVSEDNTEIKTGLEYNELIELDAVELFGGASGKGFWYNDVDDDGNYDEGVDKIITYNAFYGYRVTSDINLGYELTDEVLDEFKVVIDGPEYSREQTTDIKGNVLTDKVLVDYMINIITPNFYGQEGWSEAPIYNGNTITDQNWNGAHVTIESYEKVMGVEIEYGIIVQQFGATIKIGEDVDTFEEAEAIAKGRGYGTSDLGTANSDKYLKLAANLTEEKTSVMSSDGKVAYMKYEATNKITNLNRVLYTISYDNTQKNQGRFFNIYGYVKVTDDYGKSEYYFSNVATQNIYKEGTSQAVTEDNTTFA